MKPVYFLLACLFISASSCRREKSIEEQMERKTTVCYRAISQGDTAFLTIDTAHRLMVGYFKIIYAKDKKIYDGQIKGELRGDTLKGHFDFKVNKIDKWYRNPVAFLKRNGNLTMGVGEITMVWGSAFFDEKKAIDYEKGRFVFEEGECEGK